MKDVKISEHKNNFTKYLVTIILNDLIFKDLYNYNYIHFMNLSKNLLLWGIY